MEPMIPRTALMTDSVAGAFEECSAALIQLADLHRALGRDVHILDIETMESVTRLMGQLRAHGANADRAIEMVEHLVEGAGIGVRRRDWASVTQVVVRYAREAFEAG
jgi:hypothetical protein